MRIQCTPSKLLLVATFAALLTSTAAVGAVSELESSLLLPYYAIDRSPGGITTLFAVRNRSDDEITVTLDYYDTATAPGSTPVIQQVEVLAPHSTQTVNLQDVLNAPNNGFMIATVVDKETLVPLPDNKVLSGDYFRVEPSDDFASGDLLVAMSGSPAAGLCNRWDHRYFNGGAFSGGTDFTFFVETNDSDGSGPIVTGDIYDETGAFLLQVAIKFEGYAFEFNSTQLSAPPIHLEQPFGTIEWQFVDGVRGHVGSVLKASGKFSVGFDATCID